MAFRVEGRMKTKVFKQIRQVRKITEAQDVEFDSKQIGSSTICKGEVYDSIPYPSGIAVLFKLQLLNITLKTSNITAKFGLNLKVLLNVKKMNETDRRFHLERVNIFQCYQFFEANKYNVQITKKIAKL